MTLNAYENDPCLVSDHLYHELFHKSSYEKEQILQRGKKPAGADMVYATANTSQENVLSRTEQKCKAEALGVFK